jgi:hypothetical protein
MISAMFNPYQWERKSPWLGYSFKKGTGGYS